MDRRRQTIAVDDNSEAIAESTDAQTDEDVIDSEENEDGGEA